MRRFAVVFALGLLSIGCSSAEFYEMEPDSLSFDARGSTRNVRAVAKNRRGQTFPKARPSEWISENEKVAKVEEGVVTATGPGQTRILARRGALEGAILVEVNSIEKLEVEPPVIELDYDKGDPFRPTVRVFGLHDRPLEGRDVRVRCLDEKICRADGGRQLWPYGLGETTAEFVADGHKKEVKVVVRGKASRR